MAISDWSEGAHDWLCCMWSSFCVAFFFFSLHLYIHEKTGSHCTGNLGCMQIHFFRVDRVCVLQLTVTACSHRILRQDILCLLASFARITRFIWVWICISAKTNSKNFCGREGGRGSTTFWGLLLCTCGQKPSQSPSDPPEANTV